MAMRAGRLRHRVQIQERVETTRDEHGGISPTWSTIATVSASVEPLRGRELFEAQQVQERTTIRVRMRHYPGLTTKHRLVLLNADS